MIALSFEVMSRGDLLRTAASVAAASALPIQPASAAASIRKAGPTNEIVNVIDGIRQKRLGDTDIIVSEVGLGTQRWGSTDFNAPELLDCLALKYIWYCSS